MNRFILTSARLALATAILLSGYGAVAEDNRIELGLGSGTSHALEGETFRKAATSGDGQSYWLGYGFNKQWGIELGFDHFDFDKVNTKHQAYMVSGVYRFAADSLVHPLAKLGAGSFESKNASDDKTNAWGAKAALGIEADVFKYVSVGAAMNYFYMSKIGDTEALKNIQALLPELFLTIHTAVDHEKKSAAVAPQAVAPVVVKKDTDGDGIADEDDKCPNTPPGVVVNQYGCAEKEKASVKLNVEFAFGKSIVESQYNSEIESLAAFMKKFPETKVEIGGYTDSKGSKEKNTSLSLKRAQAVKDALVKAGVEESRLTAKGYGPANPVGDNKTEAGRALNRRVMAEISVMTDKKK